MGVEWPSEHDVVADWCVVVRHRLFAPHHCVVGSFHGQMFPAGLETEIGEIAVVSEEQYI